MNLRKLHIRSCYSNKSTEDPPVKSSLATASAIAHSISANEQPLLVGDKGRTMPTRGLAVVVCSADGGQQANSEVVYGRCIDEVRSTSTVATDGVATGCLVHQ